MKKEQMVAFLTVSVLTFVVLVLLFTLVRQLSSLDAAIAPRPELDQPVPVRQETPPQQTDSTREKSPWSDLILLLLIVGMVVALGCGASWLGMRGQVTTLVLAMVMALRRGAFFDRFVRWLQGRQTASPAPGKLSLARDYKHEVAPGVWEGETAPPLQQFITTYYLGDDRYDPSMSIEERGMFLGECGVGFAKWPHNEQSHLIQAFEVWLFDKKDFKTHTAILASRAAARDPEARATLPDNAVVTVAGEGAGIVLRARDLRLRARVVEATYLAHDRHPERFFERLKLEIGVWRWGISD